MPGTLNSQDSKSFEFFVLKNKNHCLTSGLIACAVQDGLISSLFSGVISSLC